MTFTVLDSHTAMRRVLTAPVEERAALVRPLLDRAAGMYRYFPGEVDVVEMHHLGSGFRLDREDDRYLPALDRMAAADAWTRIGSALDDALAVQLAATPGITVPDEIVVLLVLGNPDDELFMDAGRGMSANGSVTGYLCGSMSGPPTRSSRRSRRSPSTSSTTTCATPTGCGTRPP